MISPRHLFFVIASICLVNFLAGQDSTSSKKITVLVHHDVGGTGFYYAAKPSNNSYSAFNWLYFTGGMGLKKKKNYVLIDYLFLSKKVAYKNGAGSSSEFSYGSQFENETFLNFCLSYKRDFQLNPKNYLLVNVGLGYSLMSYSAENEISKHKKGWCNVIDFGYSFRLHKHLNINLYGGMLSAFTTS